MGQARSYLRQARVAARSTVPFALSGPVA